MINKSFGHLTVLKEVGITPAKHIIYECTCLCGKTTQRTGTSLRRSRYSSCGCYKPPAGVKSPHWKGVGEISADWFYNKVIRSANGSKGTRKIKELDIDLLYIWSLFIEQGRKCALSGLQLTLPDSNAKSEYKKATASLDRIDSDKGYITGNVQWVHKDVNMMKRTYNNDYFIEMCKLISNNHLQ